MSGTRKLVYAMLISAGGYLAVPAQAAETYKRYYAHPVVEDRHGVIAPWYQGQNGQFDYRVRIAAETLRRYPWVTSERAAGTAPEYAFNNTWRITPEGAISIPPMDNWTYGGRGQACARVILALADYYRYSGDPMAPAHIELVADNLLDSCQTDASHPWPNFLISVPVAGKPYHQADPAGWIQLDIVGEAGVALLHAYQLIGKTRYLDAVKHWADLFVQKRNRQPGAAPWGRYANPEKVRWGMLKSGNIQTGGLVYQLFMFDELIRLDYKGVNGGLVEARDAGRAYFRDVLLPAWEVNDTWGRNYWDWEDPVQAQTTTDWAVRYLMTNKQYFPNWKNDVRNILTIFLNHTSVDPKSKGDVYHGAWAFPESLGCCGSSLAWGPMELALDLAQYAVETKDEWAREMGRRMQILATYDFHDTGVVEDNIDGGQIAAGGWFNSSQPSALKWVLRTMAWMPDIMGAARENHIMRSNAVVSSVTYGKGRISYSTFDAPPNTVTVLRLAFEPQSVTAGGKPLPNLSGLNAGGYAIERLPAGDCIVSVRHDGARDVVIEGNDPQMVSSDTDLSFSGSWQTVRRAKALGGDVRSASEAGAAMTFSFTGNQVRLVASVGPDGGLADVYLDGVKQLAGVDYWNPRALDQHIVYYRNGLPNGRHAIELIARGAKNPLAKGTQVFVDGLQYSAAEGNSGFGEGGGPTTAQRMIFGYTERSDYVDCQGATWRPGTEFVVRTGHRTDSVAQTWRTIKQAVFVEGTKDPELYQYGVQAPDFTVNLTVGPGSYYLRLKFAETQFREANRRAVTVYLNDEKVVERMDVFATAGKADKAVDLVFNRVQPKNGIVEVRFVGEPIGGCATHAMIQAIEVGPGDGGAGDVPKSVSR